MNLEIEEDNKELIENHYNDLEQDSRKKIKEEEKVKMLEDAIIANDLNSVNKIVNEFGTFEFSARAMGLACLYSSLEIMKVLAAAGLTFSYKYSSSLQRKYGVTYSSNLNRYLINYSSFIAKTDVNVYNPILHA